MQLTPALVKGAGNLTTLFTQRLDGIVNAQPLYLSAATLSGLPGQFCDGAAHNVVYVVTQNATVYAFDGDASNHGCNINGSTANPLWQTSLLNTSTAKPLPASDTGSGDITPIIGATETPVIDSTTGTLYVVATIKDSALNPPYEQLLYALDVKTGKPKVGPVNIVTEFNGTPVTSNNDLDPITPSGPGKIPFSPLHEHLRGAITLFNGVVYLVYASHSDVTPYYGEILGYDAATLTLKSRFIDTPNRSTGSGIWQGGAGPMFDASTGNMFLMTGNGSFDQNSGAPSTAATDWGESVLRLSTTKLDANGYLQMPFGDTTSWFTPSDWNALNMGGNGLANDRDLGAGGLLALPDQAQGSHPHIMVGGGKAGVLYVLDRDVLGGLTSNDSGAIQELSNPSGAAIFTTPAYFNGYIYYGDGSNAVTQRQVVYNGDTTPPTYISPTPIISNTPAPFKSGGVFISGNGNSNGVVWQLSNALRAWDATDVTNTIFNQSLSSPANNGGCTTQRWHIPIVDNGKIYYSCFDRNNVGYLFVSGAAPVPAGAPTAPTNVSAAANSSIQITLSWADAANDETGFTILRSNFVDGGFNQIATADRNANSFIDTTLSPGQTYFYQVVATNSLGRSAAGQASATTFPAFQPAGLVAYWPLDEGLTNTGASIAVDASGRNHNGSKDGTSEAGPISTPCYINTCWAFHGTKADDRIVVPDAPDLEFSAAQSFTLSAWIFPDLVNGNEYSVINKSVDQGNPYGIYINSANHWVARGPQGDLVGPVAQPNTWTHVALVQDGVAGIRYLYINGVQQPQTAPAQAADGKGALWMGEQNSTIDVDGFEGDIDEVRLYNIALPPGSVQDLLSDPVLEAVSLMNHLSNTYGLTLVPSVAPQTEPRIPANPGDYTIQVHFAAPVTTNVSATLELQPGVSGSAIGQIGTPLLDGTGTILTIPLIGVENSQALNLHLANVGSSNSAPGTADIPFNVLEGDVTGDHVVDGNDVNAITSHGNNNGVTPTPATAIYDINLDGTINPNDITAAQNLEGTTFSAQVDTNLAIFKPAVASSTSTQNTRNIAANAFDNDLSSSWESARPASGSATSGVAGVDPGWIYVDLGSPATVDGFSIAWANAAAAQYQIQSCAVLAGDHQSCSDSSGWRTLVTESSNPGNDTRNYLHLTPVAARYFRTNGTVRTLGQFAYQINEFRVLGFYGIGTGIPSAPKITSPATATATVGQSFSYTISSDTAGATFSAGPLPSGLSLSGALLSGTPTTAGTFSIALMATNSTGQTGNATLTLTVNPAAAAPKITSSLTATATVGQNFSYTITSDTPGATFSTSALPANLSLGGALISGTPTTAGTYSITLTATNSSGEAGTATLTLTVNPAAGGGVSTGVPVYQVDSGGGIAVSPFVADEFFTASPTSSSNNTITLAAADTTPVKVYQSNRFGSFTYTFPGLVANQTYTVVLHFAETFFTTTGKRVFRISINNVVVEPAFDIVAQAGGPNIGISRSYTVTAIGGQIALAFAPGASGVDNPQVNGIEILTNDSNVPPAATPIAPLAVGGHQRVVLFWCAGSGPNGAYNIYRGTAPGAESNTPLATGLAGTTFIDTTAASNTTYYYKITATNSGGTSGASAEVSATPDAPIPGSPIIQLDAGSATGVAPFTADTQFGSASSSTNGNAIDLSEVVAPAPLAVYRSAHSAPSYSYNFTKLVPGGSYTLRLHFAETFFTSAGQRVSNISVNNTSLVKNLDIFAAAGKKNAAFVLQAPITADPNGNVVVTFTNVVNQPEVTGLELYQ